MKKVTLKIENQSQITVRVDAIIHKRFKAWAALNGLPMGGAIERIMKEHLEKQGSFDNQMKEEQETDTK